MKKVKIGIEKMKKKTLSIFYNLMLFYLINYLWIENYFPAIKNISIVNIISIYIFIRIIINLPYLITKKKATLFNYAIFLFIIVLFLGFISSLLYQYQDLKIMFIDAFLFSRFMFMFLYVSFLLSKEEKIQLLYFIKRHLKFLTFLLFFLLILNIPFHIFPILDVRFGFPSQMLIFSHPTYLGSISFLAWILSSEEKDTVYRSICIILILSTLRTKLIILIFGIIFFKRIQSKLNITTGVKIILGLISTTILSSFFSKIIYDKMINRGTSVRSFILTKALEIANNHFPFGSGFASFGSYASFKYYSPIYYQYRLSNTYGFLINSFQYGMDSYISMLLAQFGFFGCIFFICTIGGIWFSSSYNFQTISYIFFFLFISMFTESVLNTGLGMLFFCAIALCSNLETI